MSDTVDTSTQDPPIDRDKFRQLVEEHLMPLFSGARLKDGFEDSTSRMLPVAFRNPCELSVKPEKAADYCVVLERSQPFASASSDFVSEHGVATAFVSVIAGIKDAIGKGFEQDLLSTIKRRIVAKGICDDPDLESTVLAVIDQLDIWSTRLYEGQPISTSIGFEPGRPRETVTLKEFWADDFSAVITNGFDTLLISSYGGKLKGYESLPTPGSKPAYAPHRLAPIADWTRQERGRVAAVLNRTGEILIIRDGQLIFTRRGDMWLFLAYNPVITQMRCPQDTTVREAVLASCLDASFARTGACVGIMRRRHQALLEKVAPEKRDHIALALSPKSRVVSKITLGKRFQNLDRRLRQELLAIDGATILNYEGHILAVGAILNIEGGSTGGGRLAAAKELSKYGIGIKVSQDGGIEAYYRRNPREEMRLTFSMMK